MCIRDSHTAIKQTLRMGKVFANINEVFIDEAFKQLKDELESFQSTLPISVREKVSPDLQKILDVATELPDKRSRAQTFAESEEGKQYLREEFKKGWNEK